MGILDSIEATYLKKADEWLTEKSKKIINGMKSIETNIMCDARGTLGGIRDIDKFISGLIKEDIAVVTDYKNGLLSILDGIKTKRLTRNELYDRLRDIKKLEPPDPKYAKWAWHIDPGFDDNVEFDLLSGFKYHVYCSQLAYPIEEALRPIVSRLCDALPKLYKLKKEELEHFVKEIIIPEEKCWYRELLKDAGDWAKHETSKGRYGDFELKEEQVPAKIWLEYQRLKQSVLYSDEPWLKFKEQTWGFLKEKRRAEIREELRKLPVKYSFDNFESELAGFIDQIVEEESKTFLDCMKKDVENVYKAVFVNNKPVTDFVRDVTGFEVINIAKRPDKIQTFVQFLDRLYYKYTDSKFPNVKRTMEWCSAFAVEKYGIDMKDDGYVMVYREPHKDCIVGMAKCGIERERPGRGGISFWFFDPDHIEDLLIKARNRHV